MLTGKTSNKFLPTKTIHNNVSENPEEEEGGMVNKLNKVIRTRLFDNQ